VKLQCYIFADRVSKGEALEAFEFMKNNVDWSGYLSSLTFATKDQFVPLQAADVLAYEANKKLRNVGGKPRRSFQAIAPTLSSLRALHKDGMPELIAEMAELRSEIIEHRLNRMLPQWIT
jgi:hypothetical protein